MTTSCVTQFTHDAHACIFYLIIFPTSPTHAVAKTGRFEVVVAKGKGAQTAKKSELSADGASQQLPLF